MEKNAVASLSAEEKTFGAVFHALLLLWQRDFAGERLITDDGSAREFFPEREFPIARTEDSPGRTAPLANALVQLWLVWSETRRVKAQLKTASHQIIDGLRHL